METIKACFTVYFDDPFWVGIYERVYNNKLEVCKVTFGAEPKDYEVYQFLLQNTYTLNVDLEVLYFCQVFIHDFSQEIHYKA